MVIVKIAGGLGNQMFQYAFGKTIALRNNTALKLDISIFEHYEFHEYMLNHLQIEENYATAEEVKMFAKHQTRKGRFGKLLNPFFADRTKYVEEPKYTFVPEMLNLKNPCYLDGYWQSEKYFKEIESIIRKEFRLRTPLSDYSRDVAERIVNEHNAIALHIRRGDIAHHPRFKIIHGVRPLAYYDAAIDEIRRRTSSPSFFVFSDDIEWARENIKTGSPTEFIGQGPKKNYEDLELMRLCRHHILSNSTFGWWGSWLSDFSQTGITIAPKQWNIKFDSKDLLLPHWIVLPF